MFNELKSLQPQASDSSDDSHPTSMMSSSDSSPALVFEFTTASVHVSSRCQFLVRKTSMFTLSGVRPHHHFSATLPDVKHNRSEEVDNTGTASHLLACWHTHE